MIDESKISLANIPDPYLLAATDQYYRVTPAYEEEFMKEEIAFCSKINTKKNMRILLTTFWDYPAVGGLQRYIEMLKAGLESLGHHVDIFAPNQFPKPIIRKLKKKMKTEMKHFYKKRYGCYVEKIMKQTVRLCIYELMLRSVDLDQYDVFHAQDRFTANVLGRLNRHIQKPLLFTPHGFMTQRRLQFNLIDQESVEYAYSLAMDQQAVRLSSHIIILCDAFRPIMNNLKAHDCHMTTVYTGLDTECRNLQQPIINKPKNKTIITCISRLRPRKGHKYLFAALARMKRKLKHVEVWIVGDGETREELEQQVQTLQLDHVHFLGTRSDIPELLHQTDIFVHPTTSDTLPIVIMEAMFAGKPIITTNCGGIPEIIHNNRSGIIVEPGDVRSLEKKLSLLLKNSFLRRKLARNAKIFAEKNLTRTQMVKQIERVYQSFPLKGGET
ncbi:MAG TPA: glycosyltransferase family 4 protein [Bacillota bacterium]